MNITAPAELSLNMSHGATLLLPLLSCVPSQGILVQSRRDKEHLSHKSTVNKEPRSEKNPVVRVSSLSLTAWYSPYVLAPPGRHPEARLLSSGCGTIDVNAPFSPARGNVGNEYVFNGRTCRRVVLRREKTDDRPSTVYLCRGVLEMASTTGRK